ncbi:hypothetical protein QFC19_003291 [Naganishia cerealis]|uniref:Uncharacterized protein n=1 Tax=Naganishia cerealis TaxID=610337 RepID=A0ACC2W561_9TREE|nr:hypothetical protein QFC19_003291 [Naganishia cerealis]
MASITRVPSSQSTGSAGTGTLPLPFAQAAVPPPKKESRGPQRTSKTANKLKVLPSTTTPAEPIDGEEDSDVDDDLAERAKPRAKPAKANGQAEPEGVEFYTALSQIPAGSARRDAMRLTKTEKSKLPRVTAYCTAAGFNLQALQAWLSARPSAYRCNPRLFDTDCLHTPYLPPVSFLTQSMQKSPPIKTRRKSTGNVNMNSRNRDIPEGDLLGLEQDGTRSGRFSCADLLITGFISYALIEENPMHCGSHADGIDESEALLTHKREHQIYDREQHARDAEVESAREAEAIRQRRVTGFKTRPSALAGDAPPKRRHSRGSIHSANGSDWEGDEDEGDEEWMPDLFVFEYGTVVIWGMTEREEKRVLASLRKFEIEKLNVEDIEMEDLNFYYANYSRIYNDVITLRKGSSFMTKLSLSHALSQSVKISLFEELVAGTIDQTKDLPRSLSETGKIGMPRKEIMKQIGSLFILRINWGGSILDSPELFWTYPDLEPLYQAARSYLEINQRIDLLNARVEASDALQILLAQLSDLPACHFYIGLARYAYPVEGECQQ